MLSFEHDPRLRDLLSEERLGRLKSLLEGLTDCPVGLYDRPVAGADPVEFNLETVAWLHCPGRPDIQGTIARLVGFVLYFVGKYRMAANLHNDATEVAFGELQRQHAALRESEARYKALSEQLQERVDAQVQVIERTQQQLYESARLRAVGQLAAGVAHEINNPIGFITSNLRVAGDYIDELSGKLSSDTEAVELLRDFKSLVEESSGGAQRIAAIVTDLKTVSNIDQTDFVRCDINELLGAACHLFQARNSGKVRIEFRPGEVPQLPVYPAKLSQAFHNILDNAIKAVGLEGRVEVSTRHEAGGIEIVVEDDGCGMPTDVQAKIFDPFFTTRPVGSGAGLGLTVARDIVIAHRGELTVRSREGAGTRVVIRLQSC